MRRLLLLAAVAGLLVWLAAPALSTQPYVPEAVEFGQTLHLGDRLTRTAGGELQSPPIQAPKRFDLVGLRFRPDGEQHIEIRTRRNGKRWSPWTLTGHDSGPGRVDPVWAGGADEYQLRFAARPRGLRAEFVNASGSATPLERVKHAVRGTTHAAVVALAGSAVAQEGTQGPAIVPREAWGAEQCQPRAAPSYGRVDVGIVHHTVSTNVYGPEDSAAMVLAICRFHRNSNGWNDIGYNFLVDRYGRVFEGRAGGAQQPVIGAQIAGYNSVSTGIASIGTFSNEGQTPEGVRAVADLLAWKLAGHGAPVQGTVAVRSGSGEKVFERVSGHRDGNETECPGNALFAQLPEIRTLAAERAPRYARASVGGLDLRVAERVVTHPAPAQLSGTLTDPGGTPVGGAAVEIQIEGAKGYRTMQRATTAADGTWSAELRSAWGRNVRALATLPGGAQLTSTRRTIEVAPEVTARASARRVPRNRVVVVRGTVKPAKSSLQLEVARKGSDGRYHTVSRTRLRARGGEYAKGVRLRRAGLVRLRVVSQPDSRNTRGRSRGLFVRVGETGTGGADAG